MAKIKDHSNELEKLSACFRLVLAGDRRFYRICIIYALAVSLLTLAVPVSVQALIGSIANLGILQPVIVLSALLLGLLLLYGFLNLLQTYVMEKFAQRFYARITADMALRWLYADQSKNEGLHLAEMSNRYFEIMHIQKNLYTLVIGGFALLLQMLVGLVLVGFYHPYFIIFDAIFLLTIYAIWRIWGHRAIVSAIALSHMKYHTADALEHIWKPSSYHRDYPDYAIAIINRATGEYVAARRRHFYFRFRQEIGFYLLYAISSTVLLSLGGALVMKDELTLGQLVAAELVLSVVFMGLTRAGHYLEIFYDLCASIKKISDIYYVPQQEWNEKSLTSIHVEDGLMLKNVVFMPNGSACNLSVKPSERIWMHVAEPKTLRIFLRYLHQLGAIAEGGIYLGHAEISDISPVYLRQTIAIIGRPNWDDASIAEHFCMVRQDITYPEMRQLLQLVGLEHVIDHLAGGLDYILRHDAPMDLSFEDEIRLEIAIKLASNPHILVLKPACDAVDAESFGMLLHEIQRVFGLMIIWCSHRQQPPKGTFDAIWHCNETSIEPTPHAKKGKGGIDAS